MIYQKFKNIIKKFIKPLQVLIRKKRFQNVTPEKICYFPAFKNLEEFNNHYHRAKWYLPYLEGVCERVLFFNNSPQTPLQPLGRPEYMCKIDGEPKHFIFENWNFGQFKAVLRSHRILVWKNFHSNPFILLARFLGIEVVNIDTEDPSSAEYGNYCSLLWKMLPKNKRLFVIQESYNRFLKAAENISSINYDKACLFGTGPSLETAYDFDFSDCLSIVCNSIVQDDSLINHIHPKFIAAGDVVSHLGVSKYAEKFRKDLIRVLKSNPDMMFITTVSFGYILLVHHPEIEGQCILAEQSMKGPNYNLTESFELPQLDSTMNIHMLPLAATFCNKICFLGADGKSNDRDNEDFWAHAKNAQYSDLVNSGHQSHPTFDINRKKNTYEFHKYSIKTTILKGERRGKSYVSLSPSNLPVLESRSISTERLKVEKNSKPIPLSKFEDCFSRLPQNGLETLSEKPESFLSDLNLSLPVKIGISECSIDNQGILTIRGWVLAPKRIDKIKITHGVVLLGSPVYSDLKRLDVFQKYPEYQDKSSGFHFSTRFPSNLLEKEHIAVAFYTNGCLIEKKSMQPKIKDKE